MGGHIGAGGSGCFASPMALPLAGMNLEALWETGLNGWVWGGAAF